MLFVYIKENIIRFYFSCLYSHSTACTQIAFYLDRIRSQLVLISKQHLVLPCQMGHPSSVWYNTPCMCMTTVVEYDMVRGGKLLIRVISGAPLSLHWRLVKYSSHPLILEPLHTQQTRHVETMMYYRWLNVCDAGPTIIKHVYWKLKLRAVLDNVPALAFSWTSALT